MPKQPPEIATQMEAARQGAAFLRRTVHSMEWGTADRLHVYFLLDQFDRLDAKEHAQSERNRENGRAAGGKKPGAGRKRKEGEPKSQPH